MDIPAHIKLYVDRFNEQEIGTVTPVKVTSVDGLLCLVATANVLGHEREIVVSDEECEAMATIGGESPVERMVWRAFRDDIQSIMRDRKISRVLGEDGSAST